MKKKLITLTVVLLAAGALATPKQFKQCDKDNDGFASREEYVAWQTERNKVKKPNLTEKNFNQWFDKRDADKDGKLTVEEFDGAQPQKK
jgi:Ca2+-binding EF-hand superfamily protein